MKVVSRGKKVGDASPRVAIIGAGVGGIALAVKLKKAGLTHFTVFEQSDGPGGTWRDNDYPGCEVDIHSYFYSFSFMPYDWPRTHGTQPTLLRYCEDTIAAFDVGDHFSYGSRVDEVVWHESAQRYTLHLASGEVHEAEIVVSAVGLLNYPRYPTWPGLDEFQGPQFHTSRWRHDVDLAGKRVGLVGTGSTATQIAPAIADVVGKLTIFQREPGWVIPKGDRDFTVVERERYRNSSLYRRWKRLQLFHQTGKLVKGLWREGTPTNRRLRDMSLEHIRTTIQDPVVREAVTPDFPFGCKRTVQDSGFYECLNRDNVELVPHAVELANTAGVMAGGTQHDLDVLILGTGFQPQNFLASFKVFGRQHHEIHDIWGDSPAAFLGMMVPGFPNFFMVYGPNTNGGGSIIYQNEREAEVVVRMARRLARGVTSVEVTKTAHRLYAAGMDRMTDRRLTAQRNCHNYYYSPSGRNVTQYPGSHLSFHIATLALPPLGVRSRSRPGRPIGVTTGGRGPQEGETHVHT